MRAFTSLSIALLTSVGFLGAADDQPAPDAAPQPGTELPAAAAPADANPAAPLPPTISAEQVTQAEKDFAAFQGNPTREDFARLEDHIALFRAAREPATDGQVWPEWFHQSLQAPQKRDADSWKAHFEKFDRWMAAFPQSPTPLTAKASGHIVLAWEERGSGYANTVSEAQWLLFRDNIERAKELLDKARTLPNHDADVYSKLVVVGMTQSADRETIDEYLAAARKIDPMYFPIYTNIAVDLLPRWGGAPGELGEFAEKMVADNPGDGGLEIYARIAAEVNKYDRLLLLEGEFDLKKVRAGAKVLVRRYEYAYYHHNFAGLVGWRAQDLELARSAKDAVEKHNERFVWGKPEQLKWFNEFCDLKVPPPDDQRIIWTLSDAPKTTAVSPSGNSLVIACQSASQTPVVIRSLKDLSVIQELSGAGSMAESVAIDAAGKQMAVSYLIPGSTAGAVEVVPVGDWDNPRQLIDPRPQRPGELQFSPDGKLLAVSYGNQHVGLWDLETDKLLRLDPIRGSVVDLLFSPDGKLLVVRQFGTSLIFDAATGKQLHKLPLQPAADGIRLTEVIGFHEDGRIYAAGYHTQRHNWSLILWDRVGRKRKDLVTGIPGRIVAVSPRGKLLVVEPEERIEYRSKLLPSLQIWSVQDGRKLAEWGIAENTGHSFTPDEKTLCFVCYDRSVRVWDLTPFLPKEKEE